MLSMKLTTDKTKAAAEEWVEIDPRRDINYYETLCLYFARNDLDPNEPTNTTFKRWEKRLKTEANNLLAEKHVCNFYFKID